MSDDNPSIMSHVSVGVKDFEKAKAFYDVVLATIGASRVFDFPGAAAYGKAYPEFWVAPPYDKGVVETANGVHFAFNSPDRDGVHAFWEAAIAAGASPDGEPGPRPLWRCLLRLFRAGLGRAQDRSYVLGYGFGCTE